MAATSTRLQLFKDIAAELGDRIDLTATATGTTTTFVSTDDMLYPDGSLNGREAWYATATVTSTANKATRRIVTDTDESSGTITVSPAWPTTPLATDVLVLVNSRGTGVTIPEIHNKINQLIRRVSADLADEAADTAATFDYTDPILDIPTTWDYLLGAQYEPRSSETGVWRSLVGQPYDVNHWDTPKTVMIHDRVRSMLSGKRVRLIGAINLTELSSDTSTTTVPASWLAKLAAAELLEAAALRSGDVATAFTYGELIKAQALAEMPRVGKRFAPIGRRIDLRQ